MFDTRYCSNDNVSRLHSALAKACEGHRYADIGEAIERLRDTVDIYAVLPTGLKFRFSEEEAPKESPQAGQPDCGQK